jgi:hypothetical protein
LVKLATLTWLESRRYKSSFNSSVLQVSFEIQFWSLKLCKVQSGIVKDSVGGFFLVF